MTKPLPTASEGSSAGAGRPTTASPRRAKDSQPNAKAQKYAREAGRNRIEVARLRRRIAELERYAAGADCPKCAQSKAELAAHINLLRQVMGATR